VSKTRFWLCVAILITGFFSGPSRVASAAPSGTPLTSPEERVQELGLKLEAARGLEAIVLMREIWAHWEDADPAVVEATLEASLSAPGRSASESVYARALLGYTRLRRGDLTKAQQTFGELGFVTRWLLVGPFDNEGKAGLDTVFAPDDEQSQPIVLGRAYDGKERPVRYRELPAVFPYGWINLGSLTRPAAHTCSFLTTFVTTPAEMSSVTLGLGVLGAYKVYWNGALVFTDSSYRGVDIDRRLLTLRVEPGPNRLTLKVCGADAGAIVSARLGDRQGLPSSKIKVDSDLKLSAVAPARPGKLERESGPLPEVLTRLKAPKTGALALENAVRYLVLTEGDDPTLHQARELAERAAALEPSIDRLLLAAELAEDRNKARTFLERARVLSVKPGSEESVALLLAQAHHARGGPNPREAFPIYDQVLALDPDNVRALDGRVDLLNHAGLYRTALETLEAAHARRPHAVHLSNMVASQLARVGASEPARAVRESYAALRFDDPSYLKGKVELALLRRNSRAAEHFVSRLRAIEPDDLWSHRVAAEAHRQLGQSERGIFDLERALEQAPEDTSLMLALANYRGRDGKRDLQVGLLKEALRIRPQDVSVREYLEHMAPPETPPDERYAMAAEEFLKLRHAPSAGHARRTLRDLTVSTVYESGLSRQYRQLVFQPLTDAAAALSRQYAFQYQADSQEVQLRGAWVYRANGKTDEAIESGEGAADDPSIAMYTSARTFYVQFPRLEPGDVVELRYRIDDVTVRNEFADYFGDVVYLESDEPVQNAEYVLVAPKRRKLYFDVRGLEVERKVQDLGSEVAYHFSRAVVPSILPEPAMPPWSELLGFVHVSTYPTWDALGKWYWGLVKDQLDLDPETRKLAQDIALGKTTTEDKVRAVYEWVVKNTRYVALEFGIYGFKPRRCVQTVARGWGDCKDKATVIVTLLRELGIDANLVIVRTGMRGDFHSELASLAPFDHAIAYVPELDLYLDGTAEYTGMRELPAMDQGALALLVLDGKTKLVHLPHIDPEQNVTKRTTRATLSRDGTAELSVEYEASGNAAPGWRSRYEAKGTLSERLSEDMAAEFPGFELAPGSVVTGNLGDLGVAPRLSLRGKAPQYGRPEGELLSVDVTVDSRLSAQYASRSSRKQDVMMRGFTNRREALEIELPAGMLVQSAPANISEKTKFGSYQVQYKKQGSKVSVESELLLFVDRVTPAEYPEFQKFCGRADAALTPRLVLEPGQGAGGAR
jgi:cellulose synthase operon protein C